MTDLTENQKQFIRNWVAIRNTEVEEKMARLIIFSLKN